jgi:hypothetical protein
MDKLIKAAKMVVEIGKAILVVNIALCVFGLTYAYFTVVV